MAARFLVPAVLALAGCAQPTREIFDLAGVAPAARALPARLGPPVSVREPAAVAPTGSDRVVVRQSDGSVAVLPDVQWSERLPRLFQSRLIDAMQRAGIFAAQSVTANVALETDIRRFEIDVTRNLAVVEISAQLINESTGAARGSQRVLVESPALEHTGAPAVHALAEAAAQAAARIAEWARARL